MQICSMLHGCFYHRNETGENDVIKLRRVEEWVSLSSFAHLKALSLYIAGIRQCSFCSIF